MNPPSPNDRLRRASREPGTLSPGRICIGMSGGVDSSVAAALLQRQGAEVIGLTFRNWPQDCRSRAADKCCGPQAVADARMVAHRLGIPHYVIDEIDTFQQDVIGYFTAEYARGRTPNPCVVCNEKIKFGSLLAKARQLGADAVATGHYARVAPGPGGRWQLRRGRDGGKDQSYFLFSLRQEQLAHCRLPLGDLDKPAVRAVARELGLKTHDKVESQEICFVPDKDYGQFLKQSAGLPDRPGEIVTREGSVLGRHDGIQYFTIGQREGLRLGGQRQPLYVVALEAATNRVVVGPAAALLRQEFVVANCNWVGLDTLAGPLPATVKIRYNHRGCRTTLRPLGDGRVMVTAAEPQRAVTPGQAAVFYDGDLVLGGGWIEG